MLGFLPLTLCLPQLSPRLPHCPGSGPGCTELPAGCRRGAREGSDPPHPTAPASEPTVGLREGPGGDPRGDPRGAAAPCPRRLEVDGVRMAECKRGGLELEGRCRGSALGRAQKMLGAASGMEGEMGGGVGLRLPPPPPACGCTQAPPGAARSGFSALFHPTGWELGAGWGSSGEGTASLPCGCSPGACAGQVRGGRARAVTWEPSDAGGCGWRFPAGRTLPVLHPAFLLGWSLGTKAPAQGRSLFSPGDERVLSGMVLQGRTLQPLPALLAGARGGDQEQEVMETRILPSTASSWWGWGIHGEDRGGVGRRPSLSHPPPAQGRVPVSPLGATGAQRGGGGMLWGGERAGQRRVGARRLRDKAGRSQCLGGGCVAPGTGGPSLSSPCCFCAQAQARVPSRPAGFFV